jgi:hypothetical protein
MRKMFNFLLLFSTLAAAQMPVPAPPRVYINTTWNPPSVGFTWHARISADLQNALNSAHPGDTKSFRLCAGIWKSGQLAGV